MTEQIGGSGALSCESALYPGAVTISGKSGEDSKRYQEKQVRQAIEEEKK